MSAQSESNSWLDSTSSQPKLIRQGLCKVLSRPEKRLPNFAKNLQQERFDKTSGIEKTKINNHPKMSNLGHPRDDAFEAPSNVCHWNVRSCIENRYIWKPSSAQGHYPNDVISNDVVAFPIQTHIKITAPSMTLVVLSVTTSMMEMVLLQWEESLKVTFLCMFGWERCWKRLMVHMVLLSCLMCTDMKSHELVDVYQRSTDVNIYAASDQNLAFLGNRSSLLIVKSKISNTELGALAFS